MFNTDVNLAKHVSLFGVSAARIFTINARDYVASGQKALFFILSHDRIPGSSYPNEITFHCRCAFAI